MNEQSSARPLRFRAFGFLLRHLNVRLLMYAAAIIQVLPLWTLFGLWQTHSGGNDLFFDGTLFLIFVLLWRWDLFGIWLRYLYLALLFLVSSELGGWPFVGAFAAMLILGHFALRLHPRTSAITLRFPLESGIFYTGHGGAYPLTNYHGAVVKAQRYACDIVQLNRWGTRALGLYPRRLDQYAIYGTAVHSPGAGLILRCIDGLPDLAPGQMDQNNVAGNHVIIRFDGLDVNLLLAHLQNGSVSVKTGDHVAAGQPIGQVGNSGNTSEPHLHVHAQRQVTKDGNTEWVGVPILFGSRWLVRNSLVRA